MTMSFLAGLVNAVGAVTGLRNLFGGARQEPKQEYTPPSRLPVQDLAREEAYLRGLQEGLGDLAPAGETFDPYAALAPRRSAQRANQVGGLASPARRWGPRALGDGLGGGDSTSIPTGSGPWYADPASRTLMQAYLRRSLAGQGGLPSSLYAGSFAQGLGAINAQARANRDELESTLGRRGLLRSGLMGEGLASIERGRLQSLSDFTLGLTNQNLAAAREAQARAASLLAAAEESAAERALRAGLQREAIRANQPTFWDALANLAGVYGSISQRPTTSSPTIAQGTLGFRPAAVTWEDYWRRPTGGYTS